MRLVVLSLAMVAVAAAGCRQSDEKMRAGLREQIMQGCTAKIAPEAAKLPGFDAVKYCTCVTDKSMGDHSAAELKKMFEDTESTKGRGRQVAADCLSQQMPGGVPPQSAETSATDAPAGGPGSVNAAAATPSVEKAEAAGEMDEDTGDEAVEENQ